MNEAPIFVITREKTALSSRWLYMCKLNAEASYVSNFTPLRLLQGKKFKFTFFCGRELGPILYFRAMFVMHFTSRL